MKGLVIAAIQLAPILIFMDCHGIEIGSQAYWLASLVLVVSNAAAHAIEKARV